MEPFLTMVRACRGRFQEKHLRIDSGQLALLLSLALGVGGAGETVVAQGRRGTGGDVSRLTPCVDGKAGAFACRRVDLLAYVPMAAFGDTTGDTVPPRLTELWGWHDSVTRRDFLMVGRTNGTAFLDVTNPARPRYLGELPLPVGSKPSRRQYIRVYRQYAYIISDSAESHRMQIMDLAQLRTVPNPPATFQETAHFDGFLEKQIRIFALEPVSGFAYINCRNVLSYIDIRLPKMPRAGGCGPPHYSYHVRDRQLSDAVDAQCVMYRGPDVLYRGRRICFLAATADDKQPVLAIADFTGSVGRDRWILSLTGYPNASSARHGALSVNGRYFFLADGLPSGVGDTTTPRTVVFDVSRLGAPAVVAEFPGVGTLPVHDLQVRGSYLYQANAQAGLRVTDIHDPTKPREVGFFETASGISGVPGAGTAWRIFPFDGPTNKGMVAIGSLHEGVFLVRFRP